MSAVVVGLTPTTAMNSRSGLEGIAVDRTFTDHVSGKDCTVRSWWRCSRSSATMTPCSCTLHSMDRLARNLDDLRATVRGLTGRGVQVQFVKEQLTFTGDDTAMATLAIRDGRVR